MSRLAFTAGLWGKRAVVCRAVEGRAGAAVEQQFGVFPTWTQANDFAQKLNQGLDLSPEDARYIVTDAALGMARLIEAGNAQRPPAGPARLCPNLPRAHSERCLELARMSLVTAVRLIESGGPAGEDLRALEAAAAALEEAIEDAERWSLLEVPGSARRRAADRE